MLFPLVNENFSTKGISFWSLFASGDSQKTERKNQEKDLPLIISFGPGGFLKIHYSPSSSHGRGEPGREGRCPGPPWCFSPHLTARSPSRPSRYTLWRALSWPRFPIRPRTQTLAPPKPAMDAALSPADYSLPAPSQPPHELRRVLLRVTVQGIEERSPVSPASSPFLFGPEQFRRPIPATSVRASPRHHCTRVQNR